MHRRRIAATSSVARLNSIPPIADFKRLFPNAALAPYDGLSLSTLPRRSGGSEMQIADFGSALSDVVVHFGYGAVFVLVFLESASVPLPGETALVTASALAATTEGLDISLIIATAAAGAILGDNLGFWVGIDTVSFFSAAMAATSACPKNG